MRVGRASPNSDKGIAMTKKPVEVKTLKVGKYVVLDDHPCRIVNIQISSPGKHGSAKAKIDAIGLFDGQKRQTVKPVDAKIDIPIIEKKSAQVLAITKDIVQLMDLETYETFELPKPPELEGKLVEGGEVEYIQSLGYQKIARVK